MAIFLLLQENKSRVHKSNNCSKTQLKIFETIKYVSFGCVLCLSGTAGRNMNINNGSLRKCSGMSDSSSVKKKTEGKSVMWGTRLQLMAFSTNLGCFKKHNSALQ